MQDFQTQPNPAPLKEVDRTLLWASLAALVAAGLTYGLGVAAFWMETSAGSVTSFQLYENAKWIFHALAIGLGVFAAMVSVANRRKHNQLIEGQGHFVAPHNHPLTEHDIPRHSHPEEDIRTGLGRYPGGSFRDRETTT